MDHVQALTSMSTEKYLLGELTPAARDDFEEHFFGCKDCADDVRSGAALLEHSKILLATPTVVSVEQPAVQKVRNKSWTWSWSGMMAMGAVAVMLVVLGYQNLVQYPRLEKMASAVGTPYVMASVSLINTHSRGVNAPPVVSTAGKPFLLFLDIPASDQYTSYQAVLQSSAGDIVWSLPISAEAAKETLPIQVPQSEFAAGDYVVVVSGIRSGQAAVEVGRYPFKLQN
jgi:hypothetical protein